MRFWEAMKALEEGKKVRCKRWYPGAFMSQEGDDTSDKEPSLYWTRCWFREWELYEEPPKTYSFMEVVKGLREGKKFRRSCWDYYIRQFGTRIGLADGTILDSDGVCYALNLNDFEATDWIEVK